MQTTHQILISDDYIAESQRLSIAQNRTLRLLYQTWWMRWVPRLGLLAMIIFCLFWSLTSAAWVLSAFVVLSFAGEFYGRRSLAKARGRVRAKGTTTTVTITTEGVDIVGAHGNSHLKWTALLPPAIYPNGVLLKLSRISTLWLPDSALVQGSVGDVRHLLATNIEALTAKGS